MDIDKIKSTVNHCTYMHQIGQALAQKEKSKQESDVVICIRRYTDNLMNIVDAYLRLLVCENFEAEQMKQVKIIRTNVMLFYIANNILLHKFEHYFKRDSQFENDVFEILSYTRDREEAISDSTFAFPKNLFEKDEKFYGKLSQLEEFSNES